jgi:hypothetical protein
MRSKEAKKEYDKEYRIKNREIIRIKDRKYKKILRKNNPEKINEANRKSYHKNKTKEKNLERNKLYRSKNSEKIKLYQINYSLVNREKLKQQKLEYRIKNRKIIRIRQYKYASIKRKIDPYFKLIENLRSRIYCVLKGITKKSTKTLNLLDVKNVSEVKIHLEKQFKNGMTWNNHGEWHIDHIIPCASFNLRCPVQQLACFNYKNLQPLWASDNMSKGAKII